MLSIQIIASILLVFRLVSSFFIILVIRRQIGLLKLPLDPDFNTPSVRTLRKVLLALSVVVLLGNLIPVFIDAYTLFIDNPGRTPFLKTVSVSYSLSNATTALCSAILIWLLYWIAGRPDKPNN